MNSVDPIFSDEAAQEAPLRLLLLGWMVGSGSSGVYIAELADYLSGAGHSVTCLSAGRCDWRVRPYLATTQRTPYEVIELRNPPIMACTRPADPQDDIDSPITASLLKDVLARTRPDIVAIIDFPGWPADAVEICQAAGSRVVVFLHNFWPFCTRLSLRDRWGAVCYDYQDGKRCVECMGNVIGTNASRWRNRLPGLLWSSASIHATMKKLYHAVSASSQNIRAPSSGDGYAARRKAYAHAIGQADLFIGISERTLELAATFGANGAPTKHLPIVFTQQAHLRSERKTRREHSPGQPLRFAYLGAVAAEKGADIAVAAFRGIPSHAATLDVFGGTSSSYLRELQRLADPENPPRFHGRYDRRNLTSMLSNIDVGLVPSTCEDTRPNTVIEFQAAGIPVIGSRIGGIPEQIDEGQNGLLVEPGEPAALRAAIETVIRQPDLIRAWSAKLPSEFDPTISWKEFEAACYRVLTRPVSPAALAPD